MRVQGRGRLTGAEAVQARMAVEVEVVQQAPEAMQLQAARLRGRRMRLSALRPACRQL